MGDLYVSAACKSPAPGLEHKAAESLPSLLVPDGSQEDFLLSLQHIQLHRSHERMLPVQRSTDFAQSSCGHASCA